MTYELSRSAHVEEYPFFSQRTSISIVQAGFDTGIPKNYLSINESDF